MLKYIATGTVEARQQVELKPQVTGIISELRVKAGDRVNTGDVIAVLRVIPDMSQLNDAQSKVESARISLDEIEREAQRSQALFDKGVVSREENEQKQSELAKAKETLTAAKYAVDVITIGDPITLDIAKNARLPQLNLQMYQLFGFETPAGAASTTDYSMSIGEGGSATIANATLSMHLFDGFKVKNQIQADS